MMKQVPDVDQVSLPVSDMLELVVDVWRIRRRAYRDKSTPQPVLTACDRAVERIEHIGFEIKEWVGEPYQENMRMQIVHEEGGKINQKISECLSPAVYYNRQLIRRAEVVLKGEDDGEKTDS